MVVTVMYHQVQESVLVTSDLNVITKKGSFSVRRGHLVTKKEGLLVKPSFLGGKKGRSNLF